ncbi:hypothetical protein [Rhodobacter capsulatus]|jgi:hypothetical protein|uniref:Uncharacterized protein n=1 Tax=Rhodobacter capsulatus (strain ATCC BAA-309 / NBRC 16581 / SB1003) TaxID=272942 RepID=D5AKW6_RHOCB|nr:hypothetical protein [Rhodobacter capsulatus]ADE85956.1 conserved hypothetical protein [Rhodobacter capsulatus SB 1003]ETD01305.1 hypothetical protein U714_12450 [Rhodobacter capsulatus DE442]ETD75883.1 hypothetical protein U717_12615 [Rhodobacter capsulatus R121]ETD80022.1 hypothetical protein U716_13965 [Rhodobacter capsulatus B6]ETD81436.1 hypothetical protein U703_16130 [Rhodobacter capsulatus YW1]
MIAKLLLYLTTRRPRYWELTETGLDILAADLARQGWRVRFAGPRWDLVWTREWRVPHESSVLVLPDPGQGGWADARWANHGLPPLRAGWQWRTLVAQRLRHRTPATI